MMADKVTLQVQPTTPKELYQVQREDPAIGKVIEYKQWQTTNSERRAESTTRLSIPLTRMGEAGCWKGQNPSSQKSLKCTTCFSSKVL